MYGESLKHKIIGMYSSTIQNIQNTKWIISNIFCGNDYYSEMILDEMISELKILKMKAECENIKDELVIRGCLCMKEPLNNSIEWQRLQQIDLNFDSSIMWLNRSNVRKMMSELFSNLKITDVKYHFKEFMGIVHYEMVVTSYAIFRNNVYVIELFPEINLKKIKIRKILEQKIE